MGKFAGLVKTKTELATHHAEPTPKKVGRPPGKRSDPNFEQYSVWLPISLHRQVKSQLALEGGELSGLLEGLLRDWLASKTK